MGHSSMIARQTREKAPKRIMARVHEGQTGSSRRVTATANKLARIIYRLLKYGQDYVRQGMEEYEKKLSRAQAPELEKSRHLSRI